MASCPDCGKVQSVILHVAPCHLPCLRNEHVNTLKKHVVGRGPALTCRTEPEWLFYGLAAHHRP